MACSENPASENLADFIYSYYSFAASQIISQKNLCFDFINHQFVVLHRPLEEVLPLSVNQLGYDTIPNLYAPLDSTSMESAGILSTFQQPRLSYRGRGTVIAIADTGIDYQNPLFQNSDGTTRILGIWDQTIEGTGLDAGDPYLDLHYGTVYTESQINEALKSERPLSLVPSVDSDGHGTLLASIAAGGELPEQDFTGAAPEARLVIVKLKQAKKYLRDFYLIPQEAPAFQENDIMAGIKYCLLTARQYRLPITILLGLGTNMGSHTGASPLARYLVELGNTAAQLVVLAAGNETGRGHHYLGSINAQESFEDVELRVGPGERGFTMELWARESELYTVGFLSPTGEEIKRIPITDGAERRLTFLLEETVIHLTYTSSETATGSLLIMMRFDAPSPGLWKIRVYNTLLLQGEYHIWLPVHGFLSENTFFLRPNPDTTITDPGNAASLITVTAYNHLNGSLYVHSSRGYARNGAIKPDLAAPGVDISAPARISPERGTAPDSAADLSDNAAPPGSVRTSLAFGSASAFPPALRTASGTSIAAAHTAGAAANLLSWALTGNNLNYINTPIAKGILIRGADRRSGLSYPNREWGYGTLNLYQSFLSMRE